MDNSSIERMLELNNRLEKGKITTPKNPKKSYGASNKQDLDRIIEDFDRQVYGPTQLKEEEEEKYDPRKEYERLKEINAHGGRGAVNLEGRNIPKDIVESIINNPLDMPINSDLDSLEERIKGKMPGIKAAADILKKVEKKQQEARTKINENVITHDNDTKIDYELIKSIVEKAIDNRLSEIKTNLNENIERQETYVPSMKLMNFKDKFLFVDNDNNVFECEMKYKGKRKFNSK